MATTSVAPAAVARGAVASTRGRVACAARANRRAAPRLADSSQRTRIPGTRRLRAGANAARSSIRCRASSSDGADDKIEDLLALVHAARVSREDADAAEDEEETEAAAAEAISRGSSSSSELEAKLAEAAEAIGLQSKAAHFPPVAPARSARACQSQPSCEFRWVSIQSGSMDQRASTVARC